MAKSIHIFGIRIEISSFKTVKRLLAGLFYLGPIVKS